MFHRHLNVPPVRPLLRALALFATLATAALACGPWFPATILDQGDAGLLAAPHTSLRPLLDQLDLPPAEFKAVPLPASETETPPDHLAANLVAEVNDLRSAGATSTDSALYVALRTATKPDWTKLRDPAESPATIPAEFRLYALGAHAYRLGESAVARDAFAAILALPAFERRNKSTWAAYMLGKLAFKNGDFAQAAEYFARTRELAREGFSDSVGLAAASLGEEARCAFERRDWLAACELYLRHYATGDATALNSLRFTAAAACGDPRPEVFAAFARAPAPRVVITARMLERYDHRLVGYGLGYYPTTIPDLHEPQEVTPVVGRWLAALEAANVTASREASLFALAAYNSGAFADSARWLKLAPDDDPGANWLRAKLLLRDGKIDDATALLAALVRRADTPFATPLNAPRVQGDLAALRLARRDYIDALRLFLRADYWEDAAYLAERVLTLDELNRFVQTEHPLGARERELRHLLARRLVRAGRDLEAGFQLPNGYAALLAHFKTLVETGRDTTHAPATRGLSLAMAARILRTSGMELRGTELEPDFTIYGGAFDRTGSRFEFRTQPGGLTAPSDDELARVLASAPTPNLRFHYRYVAADLAWEAAQLLPDNSLELATLLNEAGGWLKARDPKAADRFYKALVKRCPDTDLGRAARAQRWFPR